LVAGGVAFALTRSESESDEAATEADAGELRENALREIAKEGLEKREAAFIDEGEAESGEAHRSGPNSPAAQAVADRAYPRSYVDDKLAIRTRKAFERVPSAPSPDSFKARSAFERAGQTTNPWTELGPFHPNVPGEPSQFFDPDTLTGPATQETGRVGDLAIDPSCTPGNCDMWVAAAGGGVWHTNDALAGNVQWIAPPDDMPTTAFGSIYFDSARNVLYAGSGEPNGSSDSEAGLGLFKSTDSGNTWTQVPGSVPVATNRSISAIAVSPTDANTIYIGTALARHGSSAVNGGRRTPPGAAPLGVYRSTDGGQTFTLEQDLHGKTPSDPTDPATGLDFFAGGISKLKVDPNDPSKLYAAVFGYGLWRADQSGANPTWSQVFHTMNQDLFVAGELVTGDSTGDETEFDFVDLGTNTRIYVGDASDDWAVDGVDPTPAPRAWRNDNAAAIAGDADGIPPLGPADPMGDTFNTGQGWTEMSSDAPADNGFAVYNYCQNGQCSYDSLVAHPPGSGAGTVWYLGSMNYDELKVYDRFGLGVPPRSNGRAVVRSTNAGAASPATSAIWHDMTAVLDNPADDWDVLAGIHPDLRAAVFANNGDTAFIGGDGGVTRVDVSSTRDQSASCAQRRWDYDGDGADDDPLEPDDLAQCQMLLSGVPNSITPINDGLRTIQFQSLSVHPTDPQHQLLAGTQDNGTWSYYDQRPEQDRWFESIGGDGGQSGFDQTGGDIRYHNYFDATPEVNYHGDNPQTWYSIYDPLQLSSEARSFYVPFEVDPATPGRLFIGMQHVWRTDDNGGSEADLIANDCSATDFNPLRDPVCGDWVPMGADLTDTGFGTDRTGNFVVATERAPSDAGTLWAATRVGRVFVTSNADAATPGSVDFHRIDSATTPGRFVTGIAIDPSNPNHAYISYTGYNAYTPQTPGHVFEVNYDPGTDTASFTDISHNLGDQPITALRLYGGNGNLFAGTDFGVLELPAGSTEWVEAGTAMPNVAVYGLEVNDASGTLYAATHGRGAYSLGLGPPDTSPSATLKKIRRATLGHKSKIRGRVTDPGGIAKVVLKLGDGKRVNIKPRAGGGSSGRVSLNGKGRFTVKHRYKKAGRFKVRLKVTGLEGKLAKVKRTARVKPRHHRRGHGGTG
jgi:hypothetical protein